MDKRHVRRIKIVQELFASTFQSEGRRKSRDSVVSDTVRDILTHISEFDGYVEKYAPKYEADKIAKTDIAILRLAIYEMLVDKKAPPKVVINEAVDLAKELGGEKSPGFINAILGKVYEHEY